MAHMAKDVESEAKGNSLCYHQVFKKHLVLHSRVKQRKPCFREDKTKVDLCFV